MLGVIDVVVTYEEKTVQTKFHVTKSNTGMLLSCNTSEYLGLVSFVRQVHESHADAILKEFPLRFEGLGKRKGKQIKLHSNKIVKPTALRLRRAPFHLRPKVEEELCKLEALGVIEKVTGPTPWVSPLVIVPKPKICTSQTRQYDGNNTTCPRWTTS